MRGLLVFTPLISVVQAFSTPVALSQRKSIVSRMSSQAAPTSSSTDSQITILGLGSLLSETSAKITFPELKNFRLGRIPNYRRVFGHPASIFFRLELANLETLEISSLSAEYENGHDGFTCSVFEVSNEDMMEGGVPSMAFLTREEEFDIITVPFMDVCGKASEGILCTRSSDETYMKRWGRAHFDKQYGQYGVSTIWNWAHNSGLRPCALYLRHCVLASEAMGTDCHDSFLDETFLVDRTTTIRDYLKQYPSIMELRPPPDLAERYGG